MFQYNRVHLKMYLLKNSEEFESVAIIKQFTLLQIQLLLQYLKNDPRKAVKRLAIQDLKLLANKTPHTWSRENIQVYTF